MAGDGLGNLRFFVPPLIAWALAAAATAAFLLQGRRSGVAIALVAIAAAATIPLHGLILPQSTLFEFPDDSLITVEGYLFRAPESVEGERDRAHLYLRVERAGVLPAELRGASGVIRITAAGNLKLHVGDELRVTAHLRFPRNDGDPGEFDYRGWLLRQGITATMYAEPRKSVPHPIAIIGYRQFWYAARVEHIRDRIGGFIDANLRYPESAEMRALIIGDRGAIGEDLRQRFALTGMAHLLVISGLHLGFVAAAAFFLAWIPLGYWSSMAARGYVNKIAAGCAALAVCAYAVIAGHHVSTIRALIMVLAYACAILLDRSRELLSSLALAALIIIIAIPGSTADIGFQLSFASVLVIILGMRRFAAWWRWRYANPLAPPAERSRTNLIAEVVVGYLAVSFWAMVGTAPLTAFHFNQFSLVGVVANAIVVPIMGFGSVVLGLSAAAISFVWTPPAEVLLWGAGQLAACGTALAGWFARWPLAWARVFTPTPLELAIAYGLVLLWLTSALAGETMMRRLERGPARRAVDSLRSDGWRAPALVALAALLTLDGGYWIYQRYLNPALRVTFLSVGEGDAAVVQFPRSRVMLIDGGGSFRNIFDPGERIVAPFLWSRKIMRVDYLTVSHPDHDHFGGLIFIARNFHPREFWTSGVGSADESYGELIEAVRAARARERVCNSATPPFTVRGVEVRCVGPLADSAELKENNSSSVIRLTDGPVAMLFAGDLEAKGERELVASGADLRATILKVPHHGSHTSSSAEFIAAVRPRIAVISLGYHNRFHFPADEVLERYRSDGVAVLRTDQDGAVSAVVRDGTLRVRSFDGDDITLKPN